MHTSSCIATAPVTETVGCTLIVIRTHNHIYKTSCEYWQYIMHYDSHVVVVTLLSFNHSLYTPCTHYKIIVEPSSIKFSIFIRKVTIGIVVHTNVRCDKGGSKLKGHLLVNTNFQRKTHKKTGVVVWQHETRLASSSLCDTAVYTW